jgi:hypothetical protein
VEPGHLVSIYVDPDHALLQLHRRLNWEGLRQVMVTHWRRAGKNVDGRPGWWWDVSLYVPLMVLMLVKRYHPRQLEEYLNESVVARVFLSKADDPRPWIRDHSNIARAYAALGVEGLEEVNQLIVREAVVEALATHGCCPRTRR